MKVFKLIIKNALRHKLRSSLTVLGISIAVMSFAFLRTVVSAWYSGVEMASPERLIVRHAVSFVFPLPISYLEKIKKIDGVSQVSYANWYQGFYKESSFKNFFPRLAVDPETYFDVYPEFEIPAEQLEAFRCERNACIIGRETTKIHGLKLGDVIPIRGWSPCPWPTVDARSRPKSSRAARRNGRRRRTFRRRSCSSRIHGCGRASRCGCRAASKRPTRCWRACSRTTR